MNQTKFYFPLIFISLEDEPWEPIEPNPNAAPAEEPVAAEPGLSESDWTLASTETVTHEYLTQSGKVVRETITTSMDTTTLDFFYDESGRPFAFNYTPEGSTPNTYYYILNLQGDVVQIIDEGGVMQAEYVYSPWGEVISAEGDLAEINPLRYRGYYYDSETGFYYLQSRYYDPTNRRFINADSYASTGQGFLGVNMFAYCNNLPVILHDSNGEFPSLLIVIPIVIIAGLLGGCEWGKAGNTYIIGLISRKIIIRFTVMTCQRIQNRQYIEVIRMVRRPAISQKTAPAISRWKSNIPRMYHSLFMSPELKFWKYVRLQRDIPLEIEHTRW